MKRIGNCAVSFLGDPSLDVSRKRQPSLFGLSILPGIFSIHLQKFSYFIYRNSLISFTGILHCSFHYQELQTVLLHFLCRNSIAVLLKEETTPCVFLCVRVCALRFYILSKYNVNYLTVFRTSNRKPKGKHYWASNDIKYLFSWRTRVQD